jgi:hypothetical protein
MFRRVQQEVAIVFDYRRTRSINLTYPILPPLDCLADPGERATE